MSARVELYRELKVFFPADDSHLIAKPATWAGGKWRWRFVSSNGRILADSGQGYQRRIDCLHGCATVLGGEAWNGNADTTVIERVKPSGYHYETIPVRDLTKAHK